MPWNPHPAGWAVVNASLGCFADRHWHSSREVALAVMNWLGRHVYRSELMKLVPIRRWPVPDRVVSSSRNRRVIMQDNGWGFAGAIEHNRDIKKLREQICAIRERMPADERNYPGLVVMAVHDELVPTLRANPETAKLLMSWALLHLVEEALQAAFEADAHG